MSEKFETVVTASGSPRHAENYAIAASGAGAALIALYLYGPTLSNWIETFNTNPSYSYGWALPFISGYFVYRILSTRKGKALRAESAPDSIGLLVLLGGCALFLAAQWTTLIFLAELSFLVVVAGTIITLFGRKLMRSLAFPYGILYFGLPLPTLVYMPISFHLQLTSSALAGQVLDFLQVPSLREGNIIALPNVRLEVVQACSGIHSLFALLAVACVVAYLFVPNNSTRLLVTLAAIPVAILLNATRIALLGLTCYYISPDYAEGFAHESVGFAVFAVGCAIILLFADRLSSRLRRPRGESSPQAAASPPSRRSGPSLLLVLPALLLGATALLNLSRLESVAATQLQRPWKLFPLTVGQWNGRELTISKGQVRSLGTHEWLMREYNRAGDAAPVVLYIAYYGRQNMGTSMHSPLHCIPGAGWHVESRRPLMVQTTPSDRPIPVNAIVFTKQESRELVLYWYLEQGRVEDSELQGSLMTMWNGIRHGRTDGCLIRISSPIDSTVAATLRREESFMQAAVPIAMADFLPQQSKFDRKGF